MRKKMSGLLLSLAAKIVVAVLAVKDLFGRMKRRSLSKRMESFLLPLKTTNLLPKTDVPMLQMRMRSMFVPRTRSLVFRQLH